MIEPGAPTSAPPAPAAVPVASRDPLGRLRSRRRPRRLRTPERTSAPPHNRTAPRGASRHARTRGRRAPSAPPLIDRQARPEAPADSGEGGGARGRAARLLGPLPHPGKRGGRWRRRAADNGLSARRARSRGRARAYGTDDPCNDPSPCGVRAESALVSCTPPTGLTLPPLGPASFLSLLPRPGSREARPWGRVSQCGADDLGKLRRGSQIGSGCHGGDARPLLRERSREPGPSRPRGSEQGSLGRLIRASSAT